MQKKLNILIFLIGIVMLSACSSSKKLILHIEEHPKNTNISALHPPIRVKYITDVDGVGYKAELFAQNGKLYIGNIYGEIYEIDPKKETKREIIDLKQPIEAAVYVNSNTLFAGTTKGVLYKIDIKNKKIIQKKQFAFPIMRNISLYKGKLYVITEDDKITCLNPDDLSIVWVYSNGEASELDIRSTAGILFSKTGIYTGFSDGSIAKISYKGDNLWTTQAGNGNMFIDADTTPKGDNVIFVTSVNGYTEALNSEDGEILWKRKISSYSNIQKNIFGVFMADENGDVLALDNDNGETIWKKKITNEGNVYAIKLIGNYVFALTDKGRLVVLDAIKGKIMDIKELDEEFSCHFTKNGNKLYIITRDGSVYSISSKK